MMLSAEPAEAIEQKEVVALKEEITKVKRERWMIASISTVLGLTVGLIVGAVVK